MIKHENNKYDIYDDNTEIDKNKFYSNIYIYIMAIDNLLNKYIINNKYTIDIIKYLYLI